MSEINLMLNSCMLCKLGHLEMDHLPIRPLVLLTRFIAYFTRVLRYAHSLAHMFALELMRKWSNSFLSVLIHCATFIP